MAGRKRTSDEAGATSSRGGAKAARTTSPTRPKGGKKGPKAGLGATAFKARALPLHVNLTHTPPSIPDEETAPAANADPGFIGTTSLLPTTFNTGSYGWKGSKRITLELPNPDGGDDKEKVHVMLTINATVMGSKQTKDEGPKEEAGENGEAAEAPEQPEAATAEEEEADKEEAEAKGETTA